VGLFSFILSLVSFILSSPYLFVFRDDHVTCYTEAKDVVGGAIEE